MTAAVQQMPYAPFYCEKILVALECLEKLDFRVLMALGAHADEFGICFPGDRRLGDLTGYAPNSMDASKLRLQNFGYLRILVYRNPVRRKTEVSYQVSPHFYHVRPELQEQAWRIWNSAECYQSLDIVRQSVTDYEQPAPESTQEPSSIINFSNQLQYPTPPPAPKQASSLEGEEQDRTRSQQIATSVEAINTKYNAVGQIPPQGGKQNGKAVKQRQSSPPVPPLPPLPSDSGKLPLSDDADERAASYVHAQFKGVLTIINARRAVVRFGADKVIAAANNAIANPGAYSPVGVMMTNLRQGLITPGVDGLLPVDWDEIKTKSSYANFQWEWGQYRHLLKRHDCPEWFTGKMAYYAEHHPQDGQDSAVEAVATGD